MTETGRYYALTDENDRASGLGRIILRDGLYGELLHEGRWIECHVILECLFHNDLGEQISLPEAAQLATQLGGTLD